MSEIAFPPIEQANEIGLLAIGGNLSTSTLKKAYTSGIFPWFNPGEEIYWWSLDPRMVLFPKELKVSKSMRKIMRDEVFSFTYNEAFREVMENCAVTRKDQDGTWISDEMIEAYCKLHQEGWAFSVETWYNDELVGGLYGVKYGKIASGESMFTKKSNASKAALVWWLTELEQDYWLIDCQQYTEHLASMGARAISRKEFSKKLNQNNKIHDFSF